MSEFQKDLQKVNPQSPITSSSLAAEFYAFKTFMITALDLLQRQVDFLDREVDRNEMKKRRKMLLLHGLHEEKSEDITAKVTSVIADHLNLTNFSSSSIKTSYRLGRSNDKRPRPIVIKFNDTAVRDRVWFAKTKLKGTGITQSEFLTKTRHRVFLEARQRYGISNCWTRDGVIHIVSSDGVHHKAETLADLKSIANTASSKSPAKEQNIVSKTVDQKQQMATTRIKRAVKK